MGERELYDLESDPAERVNLVESRPGLATQYERELAELRDRARKRSKPAVPGGLDAATLAELKKLGYIGDDDESESRETDVERK
jgi:hypothetical protein